MWMNVAEILLPATIRNSSAPATENTYCSRIDTHCINRFGVDVQQAQ